MALYSINKKDGSCIIHTPNTPRNWVNYLWSIHGYCCQINQTGNGRSYYIDEKANLCDVNFDNVKQIYLRDEPDAWCPTGGVGIQKLDMYSCRHGLYDSEIHSKKNGLLFSCRYQVPFDGYHEIWNITLKNTTENDKSIDLFTVSTFSLEGFSYPRYYEMYRCAKTTFIEGLNGIYCNGRHPFAPHNKYNAFIASTEKIYAYDGDLSQFLGTQSTITRSDCSVAGDFSTPLTVFSGRDCQNTTVTNFMLGGALQHKMTLKPNEEKEIIIVLGVCESPKEAIEIVNSYQVQNSANNLFGRNRHYWEEKYNSLWVNTPDDKINTIFARWLNKQVDFCIVGKKGVRDNLQIAVALLAYQPDKAQKEILEVLHHQFADGHAVLTWYPYDDTRYSDQPFWIIWAVCELLKETGNYSILKQIIPYQDCGKGTVLEHIERALHLLITDKGPNNMVKIHFADWNDALNVQSDSNAESVMLTHQLAYALLEMECLYEKLGNSEKAAACKAEYIKTRNILNSNAWDGDWYIRATCKDRPIGSKNSKGSKIYLNAQTWAVLAKIPDADRLPKVIAAIDSMEHDFGFPINKPAYPSYSKDVGRMSGMLPGLYENGGVYCHATGFKMLMDCYLGRADIALRTLKKIAPDSIENPSSQSGAEPYVFTNCYSTHPDYYGKSYQSWTTGTSAWCMMTMYEGFLGIKRSYDGLVINPALPSSWNIVKAKRTYRGCKYEFEYRINNACPSTPKIFFDGIELNSNVLPVPNDNLIHKVKIIL